MTDIVSPCTETDGQAEDYDKESSSHNTNIYIKGVLSNGIRKRLTICGYK